MSNAIQPVPLTNFHLHRQTPNQEMELIPEADCSERSYISIQKDINRSRHIRTQKEEIEISVESWSSKPPFLKGGKGGAERFGSVANSFSVSYEVGSAKEGYSSIQFLCPR